MAKLYANENFPLPVVQALRRLGHDVLTIQETGRADQAATDEEVLATAVADERALVTLNRRHFIALHRKSNLHCGIIVCTVDSDFDALAGRIHQAIESASTLNRELLRVNLPTS